MVRWRAVLEARIDPLNRVHYGFAALIYSNYKWSRTRRPGLVPLIIYCRKSAEGVVVFHAEVGHPDGLVPRRNAYQRTNRKKHARRFLRALEQNVGVAS